MRALLSQVSGGPETLVIEEVPDPVPAPGQLLVRTSCVGLNFLDSLIIRDLYQTRVERPFAPGCELAGNVEAIGEGVVGFAPGDRVLGVVDYGALAEKALVDAHRAVALPNNMPFQIAAAMPVTYGTALHALVNRSQLGEGETLFVLGASSSVGLAAIQIGKALGAQVVAAVSSEEKAVFATRAGADSVVVYPPMPLDREDSRVLAAQFKKAVGTGGADVVFDVIGGNYCEPALRATAWHGRYLVIGFAAGIPSIPTNLALLREAAISGVFWGESVKRHPGSFNDQLLTLFEMWQLSQISPVIDRTLDFAQAAEGIASLVNRSVIGKVVITIER